MSDSKCSACNGDHDLMFTREMKPGARGGMGQSFGRSYYLCSACRDICREIGALIAIQTTEASGKKMTPRATVAAKTLQFLVGRQAAPGTEAGSKR